MSSPPGTLLSHRYEIRETIGADGIVEVYRALDMRLGRDISITVLEIQNLAGTEEYLRFEREAQARAALQHPRVTTIHDFGHDANRIFLVAEWMEGESLRARLARGFLERPQVEALGRDLLEGLQAIHEKGFVLGSIDAASVFLEKDGHAKLFAYRLQRIGSGDTKGLHAPDDFRALATLLLSMLPPRQKHSKDSRLRTQLQNWASDEGPWDAGTFWELLRERPLTRWKHGIPWLIAATAILLGLACPPFMNWRSRTKPQITLALLPFLNLDGKVDSDYIGPNLLHLLANELVRTPGIRVALPGGTQVPADIQDPTLLARQMGADLVLTGTYRTAKGRLSVETRIQRVQDATTFSRGRVERPLTEICFLITELEDQLQASLYDKHWFNQDLSVPSSESRDSEARRLCLQGMQLQNNLDPRELGRSINCFQTAISRDPSFPLAYSGLAESYGLLGSLGAMPAKEARRLSEDSAQRALEMDPGLAQAHTAMADIRFWFDQDWKGAGEEFQQALLLDPNCARTHRMYAIYQSSLGHWEDSLKHMRRAMELEPLSTSCMADYAMTLHWAGRSQEALQEFEKILAQAPDNIHALFLRRRIQEDVGRLEDAVASARRLSSLDMLREKDAGALEYAFIAQGNRGYWIERVRQAEHQKDLNILYLAEVVTLMGDKDRAFRVLHRGIREQCPLLVYIPNNPAFESLRQDPRFVQLLRELGYPSA